MSAKFIDISEVVSMFLDEHDKSVGDEDKAWIFAFRGLSLMHFNTSAEPKTVRLPVLANKTVQFPSDYVKWSKVGILNEKGELITLIINDSLTEFKDTNPSRLTSISADVNTGDIGVYNSYLNFWNGVAYSQLFGVGFGLQNFGECRVDEGNNMIVLSPNFRYDKVILEYISCPEKDYDYKIDVRLREALISFIAWKFKLGSRADFYANYIEGDRMMHPFDVQKFQQVIREGSKFCLKL
jgi:hypothetical protein